MKVPPLFFSVAVVVACLAGRPAGAQPVASDADEALAKALLFHASFDDSPDADFARGDRRIYWAPNLERTQATPGLPEGVVTADAPGRWGRALRFHKKADQVTFFRGRGNVPYDPQGFSGTVSLWMSLDPERDLEPGYVDPLQITDKAWNNAALFLDFTKDDRPRHFRLGVFSDYKFWNPQDRAWDAIPAAERPLIDAGAGPFSRDGWTHVAIAFDDINRDRPARAELYLNGERQAPFEKLQRFTWGPERLAILLGIYYSGLIDELSVFDRALSAKEIRGLAKRDSSLKEIAAAATQAAAEPVWRRHVVAEGIYAVTAVAADFTGDGAVDVVSNAGGKTLLYSAPDWKPSVLDGDVDAHACIHSETIDVNDDGRPDFIGANYSAPGLIFWLENPGGASGTPWQFRTVDDQLDGIHGLMAGDVDGDGRLDLAANSAQPAGPFANSLVWYRVPADLGEPWTRHVFAKGDAPGLSHYLGLGDVNGDGRTDAATGAKGGPTAVPGTGDWFAWWEAPADSGLPWKKHLIAAGQEGATNILMADVDRDGRTDFFASRGHGRGVLWFEAPDWKEHVIHPTLAGPHCLATGDIDGDGDPDLVTCAKDDRVAAWFENDGRGGFATHIIAVDQAAYDIRLIDMNGNGRLDVLIAGQESRNVVWLENPASQQK